jgi:hypothetical protein
LSKEGIYMPVPDPTPIKGYAAPIACATGSTLVFCLGFAVAVVAVWFGGAPQNVALYAVNEGAGLAGWDLGSVARPKSFMPIVLVVSTATAVLGAFAFMASVAWVLLRYQPRRRIARVWRARPGATPAVRVTAPAVTSPNALPAPDALPADPEPATATAALETTSRGTITTGDPLDYAPPSAETIRYESNAAGTSLRPPPQS